MHIRSKLIVAIGSFMIITISAVEYYDFRMSMDSMREEALEDARDIRGMMMAMRRVYYHEFLDGDFTLGRAAPPPLPNHAARRIAADFSNWRDTGLSFNNVSDTPRNLLNQADANEMAAIRWFRAHPKASERLVEAKDETGGAFLHYATPIWIEPACLRCHGETADAPEAISESYQSGFGYAVGDLRGIVSIKIPSEMIRERIYAQQQEETFGLLASMALILIGVGGLVHLIVVRRLGGLKAASERIAGGDLTAQAPVAGSDELSTVAKAFNQMGRALQKRDRQLESQQQRLADLAAERELLLNNTNDVVFHHDVNGKIGYISPAAERICGFAPEECLDHYSAFLTDAPVNRAVRRHVQAALQSGEAQPPFLAEIRRRDGQRVTLEINERPVLENGEVCGIIGVARDVSERVRAQRALEAEHAFLQRVIDGVGDPIMVIGTDYRIQLMNQAAEAHCPAELKGQQGLCCHQVSHHQDEPCDSEQHPCPLKMVIETGESVSVVHQHPMEDGSEHSYELIATPLFGEAGQVCGIIESSRDITLRLQVENDLFQQEKDLDHLAHHDVLTGLPNRLLFMDRLEQALHRAHRTRQSVAVLFIDLDRFKEINDSLGHELGDVVLQRAAERLTATLGEDDTISRIGGDEFTVIVEALPDAEDAGVIADKIVQAFNQPLEAREHSLFVNASVGISLYPRDAGDVMSLLRNADAAMFKAKQEGRNTFRFYTPDLTKRALDRVLLESELRKAMQRGQLSVFYQPQVCLESGDLCGLEALVRWHHPDLGMILPSSFIPLAEDAGLIEQIGDFVLREACTQMARWLAAGYDFGRVAVNLSAKQVRAEQIVGWVSAVLEETGCPASALELEITESYLMAEPEKAVVVLKELRALGVELAIDDFGTGYSSLAYLKSLPISKLKVDASFVRDITEDPSDQAITQSIIGLGRSLNLKVLAEGVETEAQRELLKATGCGEMQGFLYARPMPVADLETLLQRLHKTGGLSAPAR